MQPLDPGDPRAAGRYRLVARLGSGGMGRVFLGVSPDGRLVAVKRVHAWLAEDPDFRSRFAREVTASRAVSGAYTAALMDADSATAVPWLASVFVPGPPLSQAVAECGPLPDSTVRVLAAGLAAALADVHRAGLIHRDLKPSNVLLAEDGPRVIDFGVARATEAVTEITQTGAVIGSPSYMSPEQVHGQALTPASDVFSLGSVLVLACTGAGPFGSGTTAEVLYRVAHTPPDLRLVPAGLHGLVSACLAKQPGNRPTPEQAGRLAGTVRPGGPWLPEGARALVSDQQLAVRRALDEPPAPTPPTPPGAPPTSPARPRRRGVVATLVTLAVLAVAAAGVGLAVYRPWQPAAAAGGAATTPASGARTAQPTSAGTGLAEPGSGDRRIPRPVGADAAAKRAPFGGDAQLLRFADRAVDRALNCIDPGGVSSALPGLRHQVQCVYRQNGTLLYASFLSFDSASGCDAFGAVLTGARRDSGRWEGRGYGGDWSDAVIRNLPATFYSTTQGTLCGVVEGDEDDPADGSTVHGFWQARVRPGT